MIQRKPHILIFISDLGSGGAQRVVSRLAEHWSEKGNVVTIVTLSDTGDDFFYLPQGINRESVGLNNPSASYRAAIIQNIRRVLRLRGILRRLKPSVAIGFIGPNVVLLVAASFGIKVRTVAAERNDPSLQSFGKIWDRLRVLSYRSADRVTVNSVGAYKTLSKKIAPNRLLVTPNPIPLVCHGPSLGVGGPYILGVGRLHTQKGFDILLKAFASVNAPNWRLIIVGDGPERERLETIAQELKIKERIVLAGTVQNPDPYYRGADIFVMPSRYEGTPNALMEAMCYGLPVIITDASSGPKELLGDSNSGLVTPVGDFGALALSLQTLIDNSVLRATIAKNARLIMDKRRRDDTSLSTWDKVINFREPLTRP